MRAQDIEKLVTIGQPALSRSGDFCVYARSRPSLRANRSLGRLFRAELDTGAVRPITRGLGDSSPRLSPDDSTVAFLRADAKGKAQVWAVESHGGEPVQVTDAPLGVRSFAWSPSGEKIAFLAAVPEQGRYGTVEGLAANAEAPRHIKGMRWHANGVGWTNDRPAHVFIIDAPDLAAEPLAASAPSASEDKQKDPVVAAQAQQLTEGERSYAMLTFSADGTELFTTVTEVDAAHVDLSSELVAVSVDGGDSRTVVPTSTRLMISDVAVAADGTIALLAAELRESVVDFVAPGVALWVLENDEPRRLNDPENIDLGEAGSHITPLGDDFLVQNRTRGRLELLRITRGGEVHTVLGGDVEVTGHAASDNGKIVVARATTDSVSDLVEIDGPQITDESAELRECGLVLPEEREITGRDGYPVHGWVSVPDGEGPFPVVLQVHGGPYAQYAIHPFDETQVLVGAGYAVVYCNPRGSAGYGREHGRSIRQAMGTVDHYDVMDFLDGVLADDARLDSKRVGIMGGSYGGYLTAWIIAHEHRFAGAIVERGFLEPHSFQGTSDIGSFFGDEYVGIDPADIARQSPMAVVSQVKTPTFVVHSELDYRCPLEQGTRYYAALKRQGTDAEMLVFPGEDHELTRSGQPRHRVQRFEAVLDWWERHLH